ncbi:Cytochrome P450 [Canna indica]|uniref:Cytochrome P450 n=1 Tax=Canna indica TaxID=4628 RepID=A0AAQ3KZJ0_9LILI|nr:Cytochrome P450 [Canna indica]
MADGEAAANYRRGRGSSPSSGTSTNSARPLTSPSPRWPPSTGLSCSSASAPFRPSSSPPATPPARSSSTTTSLSPAARPCSPPRSSPTGYRTWPSPPGGYWRMARKVIVVELLSAKRVQSFRKVTEEEVARVVDSIRERSYSSPVDLSKTVLSMANSIVCRAAFGDKHGGGGVEIHRVLAEAQDVFGGFCTGDFFPWMRWIHALDGLQARVEKVFKELDSFYNQVIEEHLKQEPSLEHVDMVHVLLRLLEDPTHRKTFSSMNHIKGLLTPARYPLHQDHDRSSIDRSWEREDAIAEGKACGWALILSFLLSSPSSALHHTSHHRLIAGVSDRVASASTSKEEMVCGEWERRSQGRGLYQPLLASSSRPLSLPVIDRLRPSPVSSSPTHEDEGHLVLIW